MIHAPDTAYIFARCASAFAFAAAHGWHLPEPVRPTFLGAAALLQPLHPPFGGDVLSGVITGGLLPVKAR